MQLITGIHDVDGRRLQRQIVMRRGIEAAAWRLFRANGYPQTTVDMIVAEVGISQRTFFRYFDSKEAVLFGDWRGQLVALQRRIRNADARTGALAAVRAAILSLADGLEKERDAVMLRSSLTQSAGSVGDYYRVTVQPAWENAAAEAIAARLGCEVDRDPVPRTMAAAAVGALNAAMRIWVAGENTELLPELTAKTLKIVEHLASVEQLPPHELEAILTGGSDLL